MNFSNKSLDKLGIFGSQPLFQEKLYVGRPNVGDRTRLLERINDMLDRRWFSNNGPFVQELEQRIADLLGVKHCIAMCNGTVALEIAIRAAEFKGEVIVPSFTFVATAHALQWQEITPVFCDIDPQTHTINPWRVEAMITPRTTGIIGVHLWGQPCNVEALEEIALKHHLKLMFDASHAFSCSYKGRMIGNFGDAEVFSFHATKFFNTFEGGAVVTNNDELANKIRLMKNFGFAGYDNVTYIGINGKMNEVSAAMGLTSLESIEEFTAINYRNYKHYQAELTDIPGISLFTFNQSECCNYQYIVLEINEEETKISRNQLLKILHAENVIARRYFYPGCHRMEPYRSYFPHAGLLLPETEKLSQRVMILPTGTNITENHIHSICEIIRFSITNGIQIQERLEANKSKVSAQIY
ncbi:MULTISPECIES: aminotransferase class I/II-fold pyridoxal phosphate-dependent enzyme [unclassified Tolypothrix]|uniref:aminotransferase class I/II-fold pyridoxal phosphate-dependent enzyme n=1 Tax=unclassified Tolypothrix TaxID=2649714 RepID=UPI0005EAA840|nr:MULTISPECIES: aminotransferase class I/II-fold pyridoxal phosphate-dependent enzyme [unclassified Tolypothrix]BAY92027.1 DegT/DnrJ/EryC1/StrS family protein [Microchaete diplosiphon NIES-3275]EKF04777.1 DegT/DnrJ/EryC1/StrS aminotransferase family protein [Tolypothrix sp. PCC 7601]MBE9081768.1 DegT/DnrJ/EryC1/StrS family aminotransferase [Tolypothrix sp. LEGE 11397]UYD26015.1 DegT/DnrJ/EryC1/StrS family aminotransferase [Tolypothrix sp. PCC 7712]UYD31746.1 DegT/DnrJ/EryC1/StrS family aminot